jgi:two-component system, NtrC family, response regulator AtoC
LAVSVETAVKNSIGSGDVTTGPRVLFVDDSPVACRAFTKLLEIRGYRVTAAVNGNEALTLFSQTTFDFVISDLHLRSSLTGIDVLRECQRLRPSTARILVTAIDCEVVEDVLQELGALCITKPVQIDQLIACLQISA